LGKILSSDSPGTTPDFLSGEPTHLGSYGPNPDDLSPPWDQRRNAIKPFKISKNTTTKIRKKGGPSGIA
jgi:hypothetical protein